MNSLRVRLAVAGVVACLGAGGVAMATLRDDRAEVSVGTVRQSPDLMAPTVPEAPVTMEGVAARLDCPDPPDPNGPAPNPRMASDLASSTLLPAPGYGEPTPEAALEAHVREALPGAPVESFTVTARNSSQVRFENDHAALLAVLVERGAWNVTFQMFCGTIAAEWRAGRP